MNKIAKQLISAFVISGALTLAAPTQVLAEGSISGAGATFPAPLYARWTSDYNNKTGIVINYQGIGSGAGIKQIKARTIDFGASDLPLSGKELDEAGLLQWPQTIGGIVPIINIAGIMPGQLKLTGKILGDIYLGKINKWNDPELVMLNPDIDLPAQEITVIHRSDGSGTTYNFSAYLSSVNVGWKEEIGTGSQLAWPSGLGGKGNDGVAALVKNTDGAIGYVEYAYANQSKLSYALVQNKSGEYPEPGIESFSAAAAHADWKNSPNFYLLITNQPGHKSWPISAASFILMHKIQKDPAVARKILNFFDWALRHGSDAANALDYVPIPVNVTELINKAWSQQIKDNDDKVIWAGSGS